MVGIGKGAGAGVLIRSAEALEHLEKVDTLVVDKTGTLTEGKPRVVAVVPAAGFSEEAILAPAAALERSSEHPLAAAYCRCRSRTRLAGEAAGATLRYLPPYPPDLNLIEMSFSKLNTRLRKLAERTLTGPCQTIGRFAVTLDPRHIFRPDSHKDSFGIRIMRPRRKISQSRAMEVPRFRGRLMIWDHGT